MKKLALFIGLLFSFPALAADNAVIVTPGTGVTIRSIDVGAGVQAPAHVLVNSSGAAILGTAGTANANILTVQGIASMTPLLATVTGTVAATQSGTWNVTNISGTVSLPTGAATAANQATEITSLATIATNSASPVPYRAQTSEQTAVSNGTAIAGASDATGKAIVLPYANPENFVSGVITTAMTGTTSTSLIAAPAAGLRNYITSCTFSNSHATVGTDIVIQDGSGGTAIWNVPAAALYGGAQITFPTPLRQPTTATAIYVANVTTGASTKAACSGYKGV